MRMSALFDEVASLALALGARGIGRLPGPWEHVCSCGLRISLNGCGTPRADSRGDTVPAWTALLTDAHSLLCAMVTPESGCIACGDEDALIARLRAERIRIERRRERKEE